MKPTRWKFTVAIECPHGHQFRITNPQPSQVVGELPDDAKGAPYTGWVPARCPDCDLEEHERQPLALIKGGLTP